MCRSRITLFLDPALPIEKIGVWSEVWILRSVAKSEWNTRVRDNIVARVGGRLCFDERITLWGSRGVLQWVM